MREHLEATAAAIADDDHAGGLRHLLAAWQVTPASAIADAIDVVGARAAAGLQPPTGKTVAARNATWKQLAEGGDPVIRGVLVASLAEINNFPGLSERIELLVAQPPDPRVAQRIGDLVEDPVFSPTIPRHRSNWRRLWIVLAKLGDPRILVRARGFPERWTANPSISESQRAELAKQHAFTMPTLTAAYGDGVPELGVREAAIVQAIIAKLAAPVAARVAGQRSDAELLAAIYAAPDDDGPRAVYADSLQERGDPRGEFIALQLAPKRTKESRARERALLAEYAARWVEPLGIKRATARFERGFVVACEADRDRAIGETPAWATVRECDRMPRSETGHAASLRIVTAAYSDDIAVLATWRRPLAVEELAWIGPGALTGNEQWSAGDHAAIAAWPEIHVLPALRRLTVGSGTWFQSAASAEQIAWLWRAPFMATLEELTLQVAPRIIPDLITRITTTAIRRLAVRCDDGYHGPGWRLIFERDAAGAFSQLTIAVDPIWSRDRWGDAVVAAIPTLPPLTSATVVGVVKKTAEAFANTVRGRLDAAFAARGDVKL